MRNEEIVKLVENIKQDLQDKIKEDHDTTREFIELKHKLIAAEIGALEDIMKIQFAEVLRRQNIANGKVQENSNKIECLEKDFQVQGWMAKHWKLVIVFSLIITYTLYSIYELYSLSDIIKAIR